MPLCGRNLLQWNPLFIFCSSWLLRGQIWGACKEIRPSSFCVYQFSPFWRMVLYYQTDTNGSRIKYSLRFMKSDPFSPSFLAKFTSHNVLLFAVRRTLIFRFPHLMLCARRLCKLTKSLISKSYCVLQFFLLTFLCRFDLCDFLPANTRKSRFYHAN